MRSAGRYISGDRILRDRTTNHAVRFGTLRFSAVRGTVRYVYFPFHVIRDY